MSRAGTPVDNGLIESLNGWIKQELYLDFDLYNVKNLFKIIDDYIKYYNQERFTKGLKMKTPQEYRCSQGA